MNILIACEESQRVCTAFREKGHNAFSCDIEECSGGHPEWHINQDVLPLLNGNCEFITTDGTRHKIDGQWDMIVAFPPCTYLTVTGNRWFNIEKYGDKARERIELRKEASEFFMRFVEAKCERIAIENPIGCMSTFHRRPDQVIHPYFFAESANDENCERKSTCLWLKGMPQLEYVKKYKPRVIEYKNGKERTALGIWKR